MMVIGYILQVISIIVGCVLVVLVALQTSRSEGLSGILAGGGGGGGKVGRERGLEKSSMLFAYGWLITTALSALIRHNAG